MKKDSVFNNDASFLHFWYNLRKGFEEFYKERSKGLNINPAESMFLSMIYYEDGVSQREIANTLIVSEANITKTFKKLEDKGLAYKTIDENNNARRKLYLTKKGEETFEKCIEIFDEYDSIIFEGLTQKERENMEQRMKEIGDKSLEILKT